MSKTRTIPCPPAIRYRTPVASWSSGARTEAGRSRAGTACHDPIDRRGAVNLLHGRHCGNKIGAAGVSTSRSGSAVSPISTLRGRARFPYRGRSFALRIDADLGALPVSGGVFRRITVGDVLNFLERKDVGSVGSDDHREPGGRGPSGRHQDPAVVVSSQHAETLVAEKRRLLARVA